MKQITLQITTHNRLDDLRLSLNKNRDFILDPRVQTIICVDGSDDGTYEYLSSISSEINVIYNSKAIGYIKCRNRMMALTDTPYAVSLDDDAHFLSTNNVDTLLQYFEQNNQCAVIAFRIFWGKEEMQFVSENEKPHRVKGYVGCGHAWRMNHWRRIRPYPEWFVFYGEEEFAGYELFKQHLEVHYVPKVFIQHRVNINARKSHKDYLQRARRSIRSGWYLWLLFIPQKYVLRYWLYSIYKQITSKVLKGQLSILLVLLIAIAEVILNLRKIIKHRRKLTDSEYMQYKNLPNTKIYWKGN
jgi:GT2 family glycosyltransferase